MPQLYVGGRWVSAREGERREIRCPADGTLVAEIDEAGPRGHRRGHRRGARGVRRRRLARRLRHRARCAAAPGRRPARARQGQVARAESLDTGKRLVESEYDVDDVVGVFRHYGNVAAQDAGRVVDTGRADVVSRVVHEPVGVCGLITPWNYPLLQTVLEGRALPGRRQHLRAQAERAHPAHRDPADGPARGGRRARRRRQPRPRRRAAGRAPRSARTRASTWSRSPAASPPASGSWRRPPRP